MRRIPDPDLKKRYIEQYALRNHLSKEIINALVVGMVIDQFGLFGVAQRSIDVWKVLAVIFLIMGGYLMIK